MTVALPSMPEALYCLYALNKIGAVANMIHPLAGRDETINYLNEVKSRTAVIFDGAYKTIAADIQKTHVEKTIVVSPSDSMPLCLRIFYSLKVKKLKYDGAVFQNWSAFIQDGKGMAVRDVKKACDEMAIISHTGGTTGEPKGVMCSDHSVNALIYQIVCNFEYSRQKTCVVVLPPFVNYSLTEAMLAMLSIGFKIVLLPKYEPMKLGEYIRKYKPYVIFSIPAYWEALLKISDINKVDMSCLRYMIYGGEAMGKETENEINHILYDCGAKGKLLKGLGSTEMMAAATSTYEDCNTIGSAGIPLVRTNCKVVEPGTCNELSYNQEGEICFTGPTLMIGYYNNQQATDEIIKQHLDGLRWLHSGDLGYINTDGELFVTGRLKRIIMTKGRDGQVTKLFPDRIEKTIYTYQQVELCCVIGVPDKNRINYPKAFVVLKQESGTDIARERILEICKQNLPEYMVPETIEFVNDLPRTPRGKIDYKALEGN